MMNGSGFAMATTDFVNFTGAALANFLVVEERQRRV
jgi:succinyl-CoA synthetase beta subunit